MLMAKKTCTTLMAALGFALCLLLPPPALAQEEHETGWLPEKSMQLVNDLCGTLTGEQQAAMEAKLLLCEDSTGVQIMVLFTPDLGGDEIANFTQRLWEKWGVGNKEKNNGVIIVVKPKNESSGQVRIQPGYGMEGALPDAFCKHIIEDNMIPHFRENDYYAGVDEALDKIISVAKGEYSYADYQKEARKENRATTIFIIIFFALFGWIIFSSRRKGGGGSGSSGSSGRSGGTPYFGGWSSGGSRGGFGGFGGGSSGGGGASGSW